MNNQIIGIIIAQRDYLENDRILSIFTNKGDLVQLKATGVRKIKSKNRSKTQLFTLGEFDIVSYENKFSVLKTVTIENSFINLKMDIQKYYYAVYFCEMIYRIGFYNALDIELYNNFIEALQKINDCKIYEIIRIIFEFKVLKCCGLTPNFESCVHCGNTNVVDVCAIDGGYVCENCTTIKSKKYSLKTLAMLKALANCEFATMPNIKISNDIFNQVDEYLSDYFDYHINIKFNSKKYIKG